jgi:hypothetical protein
VKTYSYDVKVHLSSGLTSTVHKEASDIVSFVIVPSVSIFHQLTLLFNQDSAVESVGGSTESSESIFISVIVRAFPASILNLLPLLL